MDSSKPYNLLGVLSHQNVQDFVPLDSSWKSFLLTTSPKSEKKNPATKIPKPMDLWNNKKSSIS